MSEIYFTYLLLVKLIDLVNSVIIVLSQMVLLGWLTFLLGFLAVTLAVLLFQIYLFLLALVFVLQWLSLHLEILVMSGPILQSKGMRVEKGLQKNVKKGKKGKNI